MKLIKEARVSLWGEVCYKVMMTWLPERQNVGVWALLSNML